MTREEYQNELDRLNKLMEKYDNSHNWRSGDRVAGEIDKIESKIQELNKYEDAARILSK